MGGDRVRGARAGRRQAEPADAYGARQAVSEELGLGCGGDKNERVDLPSRCRPDGTSRPSVIRRTVRRTPATDRTPLTRDIIAAAALVLIDREGLDALTMRRLALDLGSAPMAAYSHFPDKRTLVAAVVDAVMGEIELPKVDGRWRKPIRRVALSFRQALVAHPAVMPAFHAGGAPGPNTLALLDRAHGILRRAGFRDDQSAAAVDTIYAFALGAVSQEIARASVDPATRHAYLVAGYRDLAAVLPYTLASGGEERFRYGIDRILDGLAAARKAT
ncbi:MAG TPA: TetR/AcrR family transcriptional regulator C-terminal domain-containing protein [Gaiellales bacterium]